MLHNGGPFGGPGTGSLTKEGTGTLTLTGNNAYTGPTVVNGGTLSVNGSITHSSLLTVNDGGTIGGTGNLPSTTIASGGTLAPGNSIGTVTVNGDLNLASGSVYAVQVSPSAADETVVTGTTTIAGDLSAAFSDGTYAPGTTYTLINSTGALSGTFADVTTANLPHDFTANLSYDANNVFLTLMPVIDPNGGQIYANQAVAVIDNERLIRDAVLDHLLASADGVTVWGEGFAGYGRIYNTADITTFSDRHAGGIAGIDTAFGNGFRAGLAGAYTASKVSIQAYTSHAKVDSGHVVVYASWTDGAMSLRGGAGLGWGSSDIVRAVPEWSEIDYGSQHGRTAQAFADAGYRFHTDHHGVLEPHADLVWVQDSSGAFHETGGKFSRFSGPGTDNSATFGILGFRASLAQIPLGPVSVTPRFDVGWRHGFNLPRLQQSLTLNNTGQTYAISGVSIAKNAVTVQAGADIAFTKNLKLDLGYDGVRSDRSSDNAVTARLGWAF